MGLVVPPRQATKTTLALFLLIYRLTRPGSGYCKIHSCNSILCFDYCSFCPGMCSPLLGVLPFDWPTWNHPVREPQLHSSLQAKGIHANGMTEILLNYFLCESTEGRAAMISSGNGLQWVPRRGSHTEMLYSASVRRSLHAAASSQQLMADSEVSSALQTIFRQVCIYADQQELRICSCCSSRSNEKAGQDMTATILDKRSEGQRKQICY